MPERIPIYKAEREAGLAQAIAAPESCAVSVYSPVSPDTDEISKEALALIEESLGQSSDNFDLFPVNTILVSTGWNKNDDIFAREHTWAARYSPEDKPFNLGHDPTKIIGHITGRRVIDAKYGLIPDDTATEELPDKFHILTSAVIYRHISGRDKELTAEMAEIIEGIQRGDWYVSMEVLFNDFDYGLTDALGQQRVIARREETAFLTKHLRRYQGTGQYQAYRIGRVLKGMTFSGKGLVEEPANPESIIFNDATSFGGLMASLEDERKILTTVAFSGENSMNEELLKEQIEQLKKANADLEKRLAELDAKAVKEKLDALQATIDEKDGTIAELNEKLEAQTASEKELTEAKEKAEAATAEANEKLEQAQAELDKIAAEAKKTERVSALVDKGVDKAEAEAIVAEFDSLDDEKFEKVVAMQADLVEAKNGYMDDEKKKKEEEDKKKKAKADSDSETEESSGEETDTEGEAAAEGTDLDEAEAEEDADLSAGGDTEEAQLEQSRADLSNFLGNVLKKGRK